MHLSFCSTVLLSAMPGSERLLPYKALRVPDYLRRENIKRKVAEFFLLCNLNVIFHITKTVKTPSSLYASTKPMPPCLYESLVSL